MTENEIKWNLNGVIKYLYKKNELGGDDNEKQYQVDNATLDLLEELHQYRAIGTVEECREARERQRGKKPIILSEHSAESEGKLYIAKYFKCPACGNTSTYFGGLPNNCHNCGQSLESDTP